MSHKSRARRRAPAPPEAFCCSPRDAARIRRVMALFQPCLLCGAVETACRAVFVPSRPEVWGGAPGKRRVLRPPREVARGGSAAYAAAGRAKQLTARAGD